MITALDTSVLIDILIPEAPHSVESKKRLDQAYEAGALVISEVVYSELAGQFPDQQSLDQFLAITGIRIQPSDSSILFLAGQTWRQYGRKRPSGIVCTHCGNTESVVCSKCGQIIKARQHVLADFLIGAHATVHADQLLTRDRGHYAKYFPSLRLG